MTASVSAQALRRRAARRSAPRFGSSSTRPSEASSLNASRKRRARDARAAALSSALVQPRARQRARPWTIRSRSRPTASSCRGRRGRWGGPCELPFCMQIRTVDPAQPLPYVCATIAYKRMHPRGISHGASTLAATSCRFPDPPTSPTACCARSTSRRSTTAGPEFAAARQGGARRHEARLQDHAGRRGDLSRFGHRRVGSGARQHACRPATGC